MWGVEFSDPLSVVEAAAAEVLSLRPMLEGTFEAETPRLKLVCHLNHPLLDDDDKDGEEDDRRPPSPPPTLLVLSRLLSSFSNLGGGGSIAAASPTAAAADAGEFLDRLPSGC